MSGRHKVRILEQELAAAVDTIERVRDEARTLMADLPPASDEHRRAVRVATLATTMLAYFET